MLSVRKKDPLFINFVPRTAEEAVDRYQRCKARGLKPYLIPECLISCASGLPPEELEKFETWIINPEGGADDPNIELVETKQMQKNNSKVFQENADRVEKLILDACPPLPPPRDQDEEKQCPSETSITEFDEAQLEVLDEKEEKREVAP